MSKLLGFTNNGGEDWFVSSQYGNREIQAIPDPEGGHALNAPTAIPSPFARMDLVKKSFQNIIESPNLSFSQSRNRIIASKEDEKLVSQCLDLAELLFQFNNYKDKIEILEWDKNTQIDQLRKSNDKGHQRLGEVLALYLNQDASSFNFNEMKSIFLIKYQHQVIGGTSPLTLFFPAAKDNSNLDLRSSKGTTYFKDIVPLYNRDESFQKYLYLLFKNNDHLKHKMKAFDEYLNRSLKVLNTTNPHLFNELNNLNPSDLKNNYIDLNTKNAGQIVEVLGVTLKTINPTEILEVAQKSDFVIHSSKYKGEFKPLALQNNFNSNFKYLKSKWDSTTKVPFYDEKNTTLRILPGQDICYPYLTISDFLEPDIIRLVYPLNAKKYFDGNLQLNDPDSTKSYLLPLKPVFFEYFDTEDLINGGIGKPKISLDETSVGSSIRVRLEIPIKKGNEYVVFERIYHNDGIADEKLNKGGIKEHQFGITLFPFIKQEEDTKPFYRIQLIDRDVVGKFADADYKVNFFTNDTKNPVEIEEEKYRSKKVQGDLTKIGTKYISLKQSFDYIQVDNQFAKGIIIPKWNRPFHSGNQFTFAVDFGTTNTHIEYSVNGGTPQPFEITKEEVQAQPLLNENIEQNFSGTGALEIRTAINREFIPQIISQNTLYSFPHRTVISQSKFIPPTKGGKALVDFNIPFIFEKNTDTQNKYFTNLKWDSKEPNNEYRVKAFLEQLVLFIKIKVLFNGGDLANTKLIWTFPTSMSPARKNNLQNTWNELFKKHINEFGEPVQIPESIAPYYFFQGNAKLQGLGYGTSVLMDIGGGTSDIVIYENNIPRLISSYKFAGNALFGDGYNEFGQINNNGIIKKHKKGFDELLEKNYKTLKSISDDIFANQKSEDYNSFLFSLVNNLEIKQKELFSYNEKLASDNDIKIIYLYFYCAKAYHLAKVMKINKLELPMNLIFSGNGAKVLNIITSNQDILAQITKEIFINIYDIQKYPSHDLKINVEKEFPKSVTCKGSLIHYKQNINGYDFGSLKKVLTCQEDSGITTLLNKDVDEKVLDNVVLEVENFNKLFLSLNKVINFEDEFDITQNSISIFNRVVNQHLKSYLKAGIEYNIRMDGNTAQPEVNISETMFFLPLIETIQQLIKELTLNDEE